MFGRQNLVVFGVGFMVLVGVVLLALFVPGDTVTRVIAVFGVIVSLSKAAYDVWDKERERLKKAGEKKEKIKPTLSYQNLGFTPPETPGGKQIPVGIIGLNLYNEGSCAVNIKSVFLCAKDQFGRWIKYEMATQILQWSVKLIPADDACFFSREQPKEILLSGLRCVPPDSFYLEAESHLGSVAKVTGKEVQEFIHDLIAADKFTP